MPFELDSVHLVYLLVAVSAGLFAEGVYLLFFNTRSYRKNINRRLQLMADEPSRESMLVQLRRERGLTGGGDFCLPPIALKPLIFPSRVAIDLTKLGVISAVIALLGFRT